MGGAPQPLSAHEQIMAVMRGETKIELKKAVRRPPLEKKDQEEKKEGGAFDNLRKTEAPRPNTSAVTNQPAAELRKT